MRLVPTRSAPLAAILGLLLAPAGCTRAGSKLPERKAPIFSDSFDRAELGADWLATAPAYRLEQGELVVKGAHNHPLWLKRPLPDDAVIEVDVWSNDADGDVKVEAWGDGKSYATSLEYTSSGYVFIQGGWKNRVTALCRMEEHGHDRKTRNDLPAQKGRRYHWLIARHGGQIEWFIDGKLALELSDPAPLSGEGHRSFAFDNWETELHFDNLVVRPY